MVIAGLALALVLVGFFRPHEPVAPIIGFVLLFFLGLTVINGTLEVETGGHTNTTYSYDPINRVNFTQQITDYSYTNFADSTSRQMGYYICIVGVIGVAGVLMQLKHESIKYG